MTDELILASQSVFRAAILKNAGITFRSQAAMIDERALEKACVSRKPDDIACVLAKAKALAVSEEYPQALIIGCDQTLAFENQVLHKPKSMEEAQRRLLLLSGKSHYLHSGVALAKNGTIIWQHVETATLTMRQLDPGFVGRHLARVGSVALSSVGGYQIEGEGIQLFDRIEGDMFTIIGLPLLALLQQLRLLGVIDG